MQERSKSKSLLNRVVGCNSSLCRYSVKCQQRMNWVHREGINDIKHESDKLARKVCQLWEGCRP